MKMKLYLTRGEHIDGIPLQLPAEPVEIAQVYRLLDAINTDPTSTRILRVSSPIPNLEPLLKNTDINEASTLDSLNTIARNISEMDIDMREIFSAVLEAEPIYGLDDIIRLSETLDHYVLISGIKNYRELGAFLVGSGFRDFPDRVRPFLDYASIARSYCVDRRGVFTSAGYLYRKKHFCEQKPNLNSGAIFTLALQSIEGYSCDLSLPATEEEIEQAKNLLHLRDLHYCYADGIHHIPDLIDLIPFFCVHVDEANQLAQIITEMMQQEDVFLKYLAILSVEKPYHFSKALELAAKLDDYEIITEDADEYGQSALRRLGADDALLNAIRDYLDFDTYGEDAMQKNGVVQTEFGLIRRLSTPLKGGI